MSSSGTPPIVSVVVPTYRRPDFLAECLASIAAQTFGDFECIVVSDGPGHDVEVPDERFRVLHRHQNGGPAAARNTGVAASSGQIVCFLDDDDLYEPVRLEHAVAALASAPVAVCWSRYIGEPDRAGRVLEGHVHDTILDGITPSLGAVAIRREVLPAFDERLRGSEDVEWWIRTSRCAGVTTVQSIDHRVRLHTVGRVSGDLLRRIADAQQVLEMHAAYFSAHPRAAAFRWKRLGIMAMRAGLPRASLAALACSMRLRPSIRTIPHFVRLPFVAARVRTRSGADHHPIGGS